MPVGMSRASEYAGWWSQQAGNISASISDNTVTSNSVDNSFLIRPSYYADYTGVTTSTFNTSAIWAVPSGSAAFDMTSVGTNAKKQVMCVTFRVGTDWMSSATGDFSNGWIWYMNFNNNGTAVFRGFNAYKNSLNYAFSMTAGGDIQIPFDTFDNGDYRNKWLTFICSSSDDPAADFSGWNQGTDPFGNGWGTRSYLVNAQTAEVLNTADTWNYGSAGTLDLTQTWTLGSGSSSYALNQFTSLGDTDPSVDDRNQINFISYWYAVGSSFDPADYYTEFTGTGIAGTVGGVQAWLTWTAGTAGTVLTNGSSIDYGYSIPAGGNIMASRAPDNAEFQILAQTNATSAQTLPTFTSL